MDTMRSILSYQQADYLLLDQTKAGFLFLSNITYYFFLMFYIAVICFIEYNLYTIRLTQFKYVVKLLSINL
jgi:hypothetical protein